MIELARVLDRGGGVAVDSTGLTVADVKHLALAAGRGGGMLTLRLRADYQGPIEDLLEIARRGAGHVTFIVGGSVPRHSGGGPTGGEGLG